MSIFIITFILIYFKKILLKNNIMKLYIIFYLSILTIHQLYSVIILMNILLLR